MAPETQKKKIDKRLPTVWHTPWKEDQTQKIEQWPDGSIHRRITVDGKEVHQIWHSSGAYTEYRPDGSVVSFASNNGISYSKGGTTMSIDNNGDLKIHGHNRINVDVDAHVTFGKNASVVVGGMMDIAAMGHLKMAGTTMSLQSISSSIVINAARDIELNAEKGRIHGTSDGVTSFNSGADFHVYAVEDIDMNSGDNTTVRAGAKIETTSEKDTNIESKTKVYTKAPTITEDPGSVHYLDGEKGIQKPVMVYNDGKEFEDTKVRAIAEVPVSPD